jgi:hypothetical protein
MQRQPVRVLMILLVLAAGIAVGVAAGRLGSPQPAAAAQQEIMLQSPQLDNVVMQSSFETEAGIAAYFKATSTINLTSSGLRSKFRTIEAATSNYIIGQVAVGNYGESEDAKVYVSRSGWILAYYLSGDPAAKMVDIEAFRSSRRLTGSKLETVLRSVAQGAGKPVANVKFYDFRNPGATKLLLAGEYFNDNDAVFNFTPPASYNYYEYSVIARSTGSNAEVRLENTSVLPFSNGNHYQAIDSLNVSVGTVNRISSNRYVDGAAVLAIVYGE